MPKTPPPRRGAPARGGTSRRSAAAKVSKPFPWGVVAGSVVLAAALVGLLVYAALNQGGGRNRLLTDPDSSIAGVVVAKGKLSRNHVEGTVDYPSTPPPGGDHNGTPQTCQVYTEEIAPEHAVHSLEHGAVWVTYADSATEDDIATLTREVEGDQYRLMSPLPAQKSPITLTAWGRTLEVDRADDERVEQFLEAYTNGPQTPEKGAACIGVTTTGPLADVPAQVPAASPSASPAAQ